MAKHKTHYEECDVLVVGGGMAGTGATFEARHWGRDLKIVCVEKANIDRSGAVAQGLYAINCYMGMQWDENQPEDHVRYARNDLMGMVREDLGYDMARHVDSTVHMFDEWGLPMMKNEETGRYLREGKWQIMIHGESYKPIVAEAAKKSADKIYNRIMITHLLMDEAQENRVGGAVGFNMRTGDFHVFRAKAVIVAAGGASHIFKPRAVGEGMGRTWYAPWSNGSAYALPIAAGAKMTQMENRIVLCRFKDGYGPVGAYFLHLKTYTQNANGENYEKKWYEQTKELDFFDSKLTVNMRAAYPMRYISKSAEDGLGMHPKHLIMLTCDAFGVLPPLARLSPEQTIYHFLSGFTSKAVGTERGVKVPEPTFSSCFGAPFLPLKPEIYGSILKQKIIANGTSCWLINTGWTGGSYGIGTRMPIKATRAILDALLTDKLDDAEFRRDDNFNFSVPVFITGVERSLLNPRENWENSLEYDQAAEKLVKLFEENFKKHLSPSEKTNRDLLTV